MVVARRLLLARGGGGSFVGPTFPIELTAAGDGGWNPQSGVKAAYYNGYTYLAWVDSSGNVEIAAFDHATRTMGATTTLHATLTADLHVSPTVLVRDSDKRIMVAYTKHDEAVFYVRISTNPEDVSAFGSEVNLDSVLGGTTYTYPALHQQLGTTGDAILLFYRDVLSIVTGALCYTYTTDHDASPTWAAESVLYQNTGFQSYWKVAGDGNVRQDVATTDGHPVSDAPTHLYHMYSDATNWHESDGTVISAGFPFGPGDLTEVDDGSSGSCWPMSVCANGGNPVIVYFRGTYPQGDMDIIRAKWNGSAWVKKLVTNIGAPGTWYYPGGAVADPADPDTLYAIKWNGSRLGMYRATTIDDGDTWSWRAIDTGQSEDSVFPAEVRDAAAELRAIWLRGTITDETTFTLAVSGAA